MAGARTQIASLWKVGDITTTKLMGAYYEKILAGKGRADAMREVQLELIGTKEHRHPRDWASFVVTGEWGPLPERRLADGEALPQTGDPPKEEGPPELGVSGGCGPRASIGDPKTPSMPFLLCLLGGLARRRPPRRAAAVSGDSRS